MPGSHRVLNESVKDAVLRYPTVELIRRLFPDVRMRGRSVLCNPVRGEKNASLSCFRDRNGYPRWKDFTTGESGDNIDFFRMAFPEYSYVEAVNRLALLVLGRSALEEPGVAAPLAVPVRRPAYVPAVEPERSIEIVSDVPFLSAGTPDNLVRYTRGRGISDEVSSRYCRYVVFEFVSVKGAMQKDPVSGLPILDESGNPVILDGRREAVAIPNGLEGGFSLRVPKSSGVESFKGCNTAFISVIYGNGTVPQRVARFFGEGDPLVSIIRYDASTGNLFINERQGFSGVTPMAARVAFPFLDGWVGRYLDGKDRQCVASVLDALGGPVGRSVTVVEGLFDALSVIEIERLMGHGPVPGNDLVILNSVTNLHWAIPFFVAHDDVRSLLDNDAKQSKAGQKTFRQMVDLTGSYAARIGRRVAVRSDSAFFAPFKDVNDFLMKRRGFDVKAPGVGNPDEKKKMLAKDKGRTPRVKKDALHV